MAVDAQGGFLSQRVQPRLARIVPEITPKQLLLRAPDSSPLAVPLEPAGVTVPVRIWKHAGTALDQGPAAANWLAQVLGQPARLVRLPPDSERFADRHYTGDLQAPIAFPDGFPGLRTGRR